MSLFWGERRESRSLLLSDGSSDDDAMAEGGDGRGSGTKPRLSKGVTVVSHSREIHQPQALPAPKQGTVVEGSEPSEKIQREGGGLRRHGQLAGDIRGQTAAVHQESHPSVPGVVVTEETQETSPQPNVGSRPTEAPQIRAEELVDGPADPMRDPSGHHESDDALVNGVEVGRHCATTVHTGGLTHRPPLLQPVPLRGL